MGPIESLDAAITQHVSTIHSTAAGAPPGGGPAWDGLLRHYGITPFDPQERGMIVSGMRLSRGAVPAEVRVALQGLQTWAQQQLGAFGQDPSAYGLRQRVAELVDRETSTYERMLGIPPPPPPQPAAPPAPVAPSLGSIFANAQQTSKEVPWAGQKYKQVITLTCIHCGGPQEQPMDFMCRYCRRPIAGTIKPTQ
jgi:hypothetical protein